MQKKIIALAVAGLASTAAFAQSNVTVYGVMDMGFQHTSSSDTSTFKSRSGLDSGMLNGSRIGFKGVEDLGNGLKVSFVQENAVGADVGSGPTMTRQSLLALSGGFGTVAAGRQYTPQYGLVSSIDPFGAGTVGDVTFGRGVYVMGAFGAPKTIRLDNLGAYVSPTFSGFNVIAGYTANGIGDEETTFKGTESGNYKIWAINPNYANGPIKVGLNYHQVKNDAADYKDKIWDLGASYDFGVVKVGALYGQIKNSQGTDDNKTKQYMLGATVPVGSAGAVLASYGRNKTDFEGAGNAKASKWALGYTHNLSKRTTAYVAYAKISTNDDAEGLFSVRNATGIPVDAPYDAKKMGDDYTSGLNIGLRHNF